MTNKGELQESGIKIHQKMRPIFQKLYKYDEATISNFVDSNLDTLIPYGKAFARHEELFGQTEYYETAASVGNIWSGIESGKTFEDIGVNVKELIVCMLLISEGLNEFENENEDECPLCKKRVHYIKNKLHGKGYIKGENNGMPELEMPQNVYYCPNCKMEFGDRNIVKLLYEFGIDGLNINERLLYVGNSVPFDHWINGNTTSIVYDKCANDYELAQIEQNVENESYDYIIFYDTDVEIISELYRKLARKIKKDGVVLFATKENLEGAYADIFGNALVQCIDENILSTFNMTLTPGNNEVKYYIVSKSGKTLDELLEEKNNNRKKEADNHPLVSVILSSYNHEKYIEECVLSVINQTYKNIEFLVADDCSKDRTPEILKKYEDKFASLSLYEENSGGRHRELVELVKGKYIAVIHSDDVWEINKIEKQVDFLESHPDYAACFTGVKMIGEDSSVTSQQVNPFKQINMSKEKWLNYFYNHGNCLAHPSVVIKSEIYKKAISGYTNRFVQLGDYYAWLQMIISYDIHIIESELTRFRIHSGKNENTSAINNMSIRRTRLENEYIWYDIFRSISDIRFADSFKSEFINPKSSSHDEIACEKIAYLLGKNDVISIHLGINLYYELCTTASIAKMLSDIYGLTQEKIKTYEGKLAVMYAD